MFTGLIEEVGKVVKINMGSSSGTIDIQAKKVLDNSKIGDSIAVNVFPLSFVAVRHTPFTAILSPILEPSRTFFA
jgi:riboflavin synthase